MNDIKPPKPPKQDIQDNPDVSSTSIKTNVQPGETTNVGKPVRHWGKAVILGLLALPLVIAAVYGIQQWYKLSKVYRVGTHSFTYGQIEARAAKMKKGFSGKPNAEVQAQMLTDAKNKLALLAGLKSEADKRKIGYDKAVIDSYMGVRYAEEGGKAKYMANMKQSAGWTEQDVYDFGTTLFLQSQLESELLAQKRFTIIYVRWDGIKLFDSKNYATVYERRKAELANKYLPLLKEGLPIDALRLRVEVSDKADEATTRRAYETTKNAPIQIQDFDPTGVSFTNYSEGEDVMTRLNAMKTPRSTIGPFKGADGRLMIARLEAAKGGKYYGWDDFTKQVRQSAGLVQAESTIDLSGLGKRIAASMQSSFLSPQRALAAQTAINCISPNHSVTYNFSVWSTKTNDRIWSPSYSMSGSGTRQVRANNSGEDYYCDPGSYSAAGWSVGGTNADGYATVSIARSSNFGVLTIISDCWGYPIAIGTQPPSLGANWIYDHGGDPSGSYGNGTTINKDFWYKPKTNTNPQPQPPPPPPPPANTPYCVMTSSKVSANRWQVSWTSYNYFGANLSGRLYNSVSNSTDNSVGLSESNHRVIVPDGETGTVTFTMLNNGQPTSVTCFAYVGTNGSNPPPSNPPPPPPPTVYYSCAITADGTNPLDSSTTPISAETTIDAGDTVTLKAAIVTRWISDDTIVQNGGTMNIQWDLVSSWSDTVLATSPNPGGGITPSGDGWDGLPYVTFTRKPLTVQDYTLRSTQYPYLYPPCFARVNVNTPAAPAYGPLLKTTKGDVTAAGLFSTAGMIRTQRSTPPTTAVTTAAEYVVLGKLVDFFCSARGFDLGLTITPVCTPGVSSYNGYSTNDDGLTGLGGANDPVIKNVGKILNNSAADINSCSDAKPYFKYADISPQLTSGNFGSTDKCAVIGTQPSGNFGAHTFTQGRATIYIDGNITITGNNIIGSAGPYGSVNAIPNVGLVVKGDITINSSVTNLDMSLYATGKIKTCSDYPDTEGDKCNKQLRIRGIVAAAKGFEFGRIIPTIPAFNQATPSELIVGSGLVDAFPPPGFIDVSSRAATGVKILTNEANPRF